MGTFFIGGSQSSGAAILQELLCRDLTCRTLPDTPYLRMLMETYRVGKQEFEQGTRACFGNLVSYRRFNADTARRFLGTCSARHPEIQHLLIKDPRLTMYFPEVFELLPDARFILIVRDPRDLVAGLLQPDEKLREVGVSHIFQRRRMRQLCQYVQSFYLPALRCELSGFRQRLHVVRHEDLVRKPQAILAQLQASTGLQLEPPEAAAAPASPPIVVASAVGDGRTSPPETFGDIAVGHYRQVLSRREASAVAVEMHDFFITFGYA